MIKKNNQKTYKIISSPSPKAQNIASLLKSKLTALTEVDSFKPNYLFIIGGDGTFIKQAVLHNYKGVNIVGINGGNVGFYTAFGERDVHTLCSSLEKAQFEPINFLDIQIADKKVLVLNEISVVSSTAFPLDIYFNDKYYEKFRGTGVLVGTRTGSTGFIKSAKGAVIFPGFDCLEFVELDPLLHVGFITIQSPLILPGNTKIRIVPSREYAQSSNCPRVYGDGNEINTNFCAGEINLQTVKSNAKFLIPTTMGEFIDKLRQTFIKE